MRLREQVASRCGSRCPSRWEQVAARPAPPAAGWLESTMSKSRRERSRCRHF